MQESFPFDFPENVQAGDGDFEIFNDRELDRQYTSQLSSDELTVDNRVPNPSLLRQFK